MNKRPFRRMTIFGLRIGKTRREIVASASHPIVVARLRGGLGNQLFQYAIGRAIAEMQGRMLVLDDVALTADHPQRTKRQYELFAFEIQAELTSQVHIERNGFRTVIMENRRGFHHDVLKSNPFPHLELDGFWQNERYFCDIAGLLRNHFRMKPGPWDLSPWRREIAGIRNSICVHVRRTDYLYPDTTVQFVGRAYYLDAIARMKRDVPDCHFFFFSDDLPWCRENLRLDHPHAFVEHGKKQSNLSLVDFNLMTMCRHFIIANSSYSWWPAWLSTDPEKIVIAPKTWFNDIPADSAAVTPQNWLRL